jgi:hypothetical protein
MVLVAVGSRAWGSLELVARQVRAAVEQRPRVPAVSVEEGPLSRLFGPHDTRVVLDARAVVWMIDEPLASLLCGNPPLLQRTIDTATVAHRQVVVLPVAGTPESRELLRRLHGLGVEVRSPAAGGEVLVEVVRPDGVTLVALAGPPHPDAPSPDRDQLRSHLVRVADDAPGAMPELLDLLTSWPHELSLIAKPNPGGGGHVIAPRAWPGVRQALVAWPDQEWLLRAAHQMGETATFGVAGMTPKVLFPWVAGLGRPLMLGVVPPDRPAAYVLVDLEHVRELSRRLGGQPP